MPVMLASYEDTSKHIEERPVALGSDLSIRTFGAKGRFWINGEDTAPENISVDYVWLGFHINASGNRQGVLETLLRCKHIGVLQTFNASLDDPVYKRISNKGVRICNTNAQARWGQLFLDNSQLFCSGEPLLMEFNPKDF